MDDRPNFWSKFICHCDSFGVQDARASFVVCANFWRGGFREWFVGFRGGIWVKPEVDPPRILARCRAVFCSGISVIGEHGGHKILDREINFGGIRRIAARPQNDIGGSCLVMLL